MIVSIIICTYKRSDLLAHCLEALSQQNIPSSQFEVLVVDNNSPDDTQAVAAKYAARFEHYKVVLESNQGLSYARNRGYQEAKGDWVVYLDDDAKARPNFVERALWVIEQGKYPCFGGIDVPWYKDGRPHWFKDEYVSSRLDYKTLSRVKEGWFITGFAMVFKKSILETFEGFSTALGMTGDKIAYGEETELQLRLREKGIAIGYDPELIVDHYVHPYKTKVDWFFKAYFALGRDLIEMKKRSTSTWYLILTFLTACGLLLVHLCIYTPKLWFKKDYYIQNWLIDVFKKMAKRIAYIYYALLGVD